MSRFGSFASPASAGGKRNPAIPNDTAAISTPPPSYWSKESREPWLTGFSDTGATPFYLPPAPNAPSDNVVKHLDPTVVQTAKYIYGGPNTKDAKLEFAKTIADLQAVIAQSDGV